MPADRYQKLVGDAKRNIVEIRPTDATEKMKSGDVVLIDVREKEEWDEEHIPDAVHLSRGTIEFDIEERVPDPNTAVILHCGGGGRSALAAESLQKMGYKNGRSMAGGLKAWKAAGLPAAEGQKLLGERGGFDRAGFWFGFHCLVLGLGGGVLRGGGVL